MLSSYQITEQITTELPESSWGEVNRRLRFEEIVWSACGNEEFLTKLLSRSHSDLPENWRPGIVGLTALSIFEPQTAPDPLAWLTETVPGRGLLASSYDALFSVNAAAIPSIEANSTLSATQMLTKTTIEALALRQSAINSSQFNMVTICEAATKDIRRWASPLTWLYSLMDDPAPLVDNLLSSGSPEAARLVVRLWLANESLVDLHGLIQTAVPTLESSLQLAVSDAFRSYGASNLSELVGSTTSADCDTAPSLPTDTKNLTNVAAYILQATKLGLLHTFAENDIGRDNLKDALQGTQMLACELAILLGKAELNKGDGVSALAAFEQAHALSLDENTTRSLIAEARICLGQAEEARILLARSMDNSICTLLALSRAQAASGDFNMAEETALRVIDLASDREDLLGLAHVLSQIGAANAASNTLERLISLLPASTEMLIWKSKELARCGKCVEAREAAYEALALDPSSADSHIAFAHALSNSGTGVDSNDIQAFSHWQRAVELRPDSVSALTGFANSALALDKPQKAIELSELAIQCFESEEYSSEDISTIGEAYTILGKASSALGNTEEAMKHFQKAASIAPGNPSSWMALSHHHRANDHLDLALASLESGLQSVGAQNPRDAAPLWVATAELKEHMGHPEEAIEALHSAARLQPTSGSIHRHLGNLLRKHGTSAQAVEALRYAAKYLPSDPSIWYEMAQACEADGNSEEALIAYQRAQNSGNNATALSKDLGKLAFRLGKHDLARPNLAVAAEDDTADIETLMMLGNALEDTDDANQALELYQRAIQMDPDRPELLVRLARCFLALERPEAAIAALKSASDRNRDDVLLQRTLGEAYIQSGLWDDALLSLEQAAGHSTGDPQIARLVAHAAHKGDQPGRAIETLLQATRLSPNDASLHVDLGRSYCKAQQWQEAKSSLERAVELEPDQADHLLVLADCLNSMGNADQALQTLERAALLEPENSPVLRALAETHSKTGNHNSAHSVFLRAANVQTAGSSSDISTSKDERALNLRRAGDSLWELQDKDKAITLWQQALRDSPDDVAVQSQLGTALISRGRHGEALDAFEAASKSDPKNATYALGAAEAAVALGELHRAQKHIEPITELRLEKPEQLYALGRVYRALGHQDRALVAFRKACDLAPKKGSYLATTAATLVDVGELGEAASMAETALAIDPDSIDTAMIAGTVFLNAGQNAKACDSLGLVLRADSSDVSTHLSIARDLVLDSEKRHQSMGPDYDLTHLSLQKSLIDEALDRATSLNAHADDVQEWRARAMVIGGEESEATSILEGLAHKRPSPGIYCSLAMAYCLDERYDAAQETLRLVLNQDPSDMQALLVSSRIDAAQGNSDAEIETLRRASEFSPQDPTAHYMLGAALFESNDPESGRESFTRALQLDPNRAGWHFRMAELHRERHDPDTALAHYHQAVQLANELQLPASLTAKYTAALGRSHAKDGDYLAARHEYEKAIDLVADTPGWHTAAGKACLSTDDPDAALVHFENAANLVSNEAEPLIGRMQALLLLGRDAEAEEHALNALKLDPTNSTALLALADLFATRGEHDNALAALDQALDNAADPRLPLLAKARLNADLGLSDQALSHLKQALELDVQDHTAWGLAGDLYAQTGNAHNAYEAYTRACEIAPLVSRYHMRLGELSRLGDNLDQALVHLNRAADLELTNEEKAAVHASLGKIFEERRQFDRAHKAYAIAIHNHPDAAQYHLRAGVALKQLKDYDAAIIRLEKAVALDPRSIDARRQLAAVSALGLVNSPAQ